MEKDDKNEKIDWHPGFVNAIKLEFFENDKELIYESEKILNQQPIKIDLLIVKKDASVKIKNEIGKDFLGHNILEFKSDDDELNIDTVFKVLAYACLYKSYSKTVNEIKAEDITITILRSRNPKNLITQLKNQNQKIELINNGIYKISGFQFPIKLIVTKELTSNNHIWISSITRKLNEKQLTTVMNEAKMLKSNAEKQYATSVISVISRLNTQEIEELKKKGVFTMGKTLFEIFKPELDELKEQIRIEATREGIAEGRAKGIAEGRAEGIQQDLL